MGFTSPVGTPGFSSGDSGDPADASNSADISGLPAASAYAGTEVFPVVQSGITKKGLISAIATYIQSALTSLQFGGTTSSFPMLKRSSATLETKLADDTAYAQHKAASFAPQTTAGIIGTATNDDAAAGSVGALVESEIASGSAVSLVTATAKDVTSISLPAGDWDVWGQIVIATNAATVVTEITGGIHTTSNTQPTAPNKGGISYSKLTFPTGAAQIIPTGMRRYSFASTTTVYLVATAVFTVNTASVYGYIGARRRR